MNKPSVPMDHSHQGTKTRCIPSVTLIGPEGDQQGHSKGGCGEGQRECCCTLLLSEVWKAVFLLQSRLHCQSTSLQRPFFQSIHRMSRREGGRREGGS